jgi:two-component system OmpR family response regulator
MAEALASRGFAVEGTDGLSSALSRGEHADAVIIGLDLPDGSLGDAIRLLGDRRPGLVLGVLGAAEEEVDEVIALELGADFCLPRGASPRLAAARLRAALRRSAPAPALAEPPALAEAPWPSPDQALTFDPASRTARRADGTAVPLTRAEAEILLMLARAQGASVSREHISLEVLGRPHAYADRTVDNLVLSLRRKLGLGAEFGPIRAVRRVGYRMLPRTLAPGAGPREPRAGSR